MFNLGSRNILVSGAFKKGKTKQTGFMKGLRYVQGEITESRAQAISVEAASNRLMWVGGK